MKKILGLCLFLFSLSGYTAAPAWKILPDSSTLTFTATQNNAPIKGKFTQFDGNILFDPNNLEQSKVVFTVATDSVSTALKDIADMLKTADWLSSVSFPKATFETTEIKKQNDKQYEAHGNLTIRNKTFPLLVQFTVDNLSPREADIKGKASFKRTSYGLGQGEWAKTDDVKDEVTIDFNLKLAPLSVSGSVTN